MKIQKIRAALTAPLDILAMPFPPVRRVGKTEARWRSERLRRRLSWLRTSRGECAVERRVV
jgi:hypothetical protein